jgi:Fe-S cluster assembly protein SufD
MKQDYQIISKSSRVDIRVLNNQKTILVCDGKQDMEVCLDIHLFKKQTTADIVVIAVCAHQAKVTIRTNQYHHARETTSTLLVKSAVFDTASFTFDGVITIDKHAVKTDAYQRNENLILSPDASVISKPTLEILADDVRCTHGAATAPVNEEEIWYLESKGISAPDAQSLIIRGFLQQPLLARLSEGVRNTIMHRIMREHSI